LPFVTLTPVSGQSIDRSTANVCVCLLASFSSHTYKFHQMFCTHCYLWPWLGSSLTGQTDRRTDVRPWRLVQYVMYLRFCWWRYVPTMGQIDQNHAQRRVSSNSLVAAPGAKFVISVYILFTFVIAW